MKSKYLSILASLTLACTASSCVDLDLAPTDQKSTATMWQTADDAEQGVSILYNWITSAIWQNDEDVYTDNATHGIKWAVGNRAHGLWEATDFSWSYEYSYIRYANLVFANIDNVEGLTQSERDNILGQAHLFRGWIYLDLIKQYGDVPYYTEPLELSEQGDIVRTDWKTVYDASMKDLDEAISMLPAYTSNGRVNQGVANSIKARYALYFANPECPHYVDNGYQVAAAAAKAIIDSGNYALYDGDYSGTAKDYTGHYSEMFWGFNIDNSKEGILTTYQNSALGTGSYFIGLECFPTLGWGGTNPTQDLVDCFEDAEGAPIEKSAIYDPLQPKLNRDPRLTTNVLFTGDVLYGEEINTKPVPAAGVRALYGYAKACGDATLTGYQACKWLNPDVYPGSVGWNHDQASATFRYTETLLTYAECMNEMNGLCDEAFEYVNKVRARVGMPALQKTDPSLPTYCATQDDLRQRIRNEWRVEFCFEGDHRQWDARRWNIATDVLNADRYTFKFEWTDDTHQDCNLYVGTALKITEQIIRYSAHNYLFPIPQHDLDLNKQLTQNPGYDGK